MRKLLLSLACSAVFALAAPGPPPVPAGFDI